MVSGPQLLVRKSPVREKVQNLQWHLRLEDHEPWFREDSPCSERALGRKVGGAKRSYIEYEETFKSPEGLSSGSQSSLNVRSSERKEKEERREGVEGFEIDPLKPKSEKKKKKKKQKVSEGGDPPGSSGSSGDSSDEDEDEEDGSEDSSDEESSEEKKARRLQAPLKRKSMKKRGSVITLLLEQIAEQMQDLSTSHEDLLTSGPKVGTYWQINLKNRYHAGHPALRELYLLATVIDRLRGGQLLEALDALAGRFIAVEAATHDGWNIAKHLEVAVTVPSEQAIAPAELQLAARKHYNLVARAQGYDGKGSWRSSGSGRGWGSSSNRDDGKGWWRSKGGKEGKEGRGKGSKWKGGKEGGKQKGRKQEGEGEKAEA